MTRQKHTMNGRDMIDRDSSTLARVLYFALAGRCFMRAGYGRSVA